MKLKDNQFYREEKIYFKCRCWNRWEGDKCPAPEDQPIQYTQFEHITPDSLYWMGGTGSERLKSKYNGNLLLPLIKEFCGKPEEFYHMTEIKYKDLKFIKEKIIDRLNDDIFLYDILTREEQEELLKIQEKIGKVLKEDSQFF